MHHAFLLSYSRRSPILLAATFSSEQRPQIAPGNRQHRAYAPSVRALTLPTVPTQVLLFSTLFVLSMLTGEWDNMRTLTWPPYPAEAPANSHRENVNMSKHITSVIAAATRRCVYKLLPRLAVVGAFEFARKGSKGLQNSFRQGQTS